MPSDILTTTSISSANTKNFFWESYPRYSLRWGGSGAPDRYPEWKWRTPLNMHIYEERQSQKVIQWTTNLLANRFLVHCMTFWDCLSSYICMFRGVRHFHPAWHYRQQGLWRAPILAAPRLRRSTVSLPVQLGFLRKNQSLSCMPPSMTITVLKVGDNHNRLCPVDALLLGLDVTSNWARCC